MKPLILFLLLFVIPPLQAQKPDTIKLLTGELITGTILDDDGSIIVIKSEGKTLSIKKTEIDNETNRNEADFAKRNNELKTVKSSTTNISITNDCCKDVEYLRYCLGKYYSQSNTGIGLGVVGLIVGGIGIYKNAPTVIYSGAGIAAVAAIISYDSRKWIKRASLGANGVVISF